MKQIDFVDQARDEQPVAAKTKTPDPAALRRNTAARRKAKSAPTKPPRKNRPAGSRDDMQRLNMEIPRQLHKRLKLKAIYEDRTVTDIVLQAINDYLNSH